MVALEPCQDTTAEVATARAHLARVLGRNLDHAFPTVLQLVLHEGFELEVGPAAERAVEPSAPALALPELQVLQGQHVEVGRCYLLGDSVVDIALEPSFPPDQAPQPG